MAAIVPSVVAVSMRSIPNSVVVVNGLSKTVIMVAVSPNAAGMAMFLGLDCFLVKELMPIDMSGDSASMIVARVTVSCVIANELQVIDNA